VRRRALLPPPAPQRLTALRPRTLPAASPSPRRWVMRHGGPRGGAPRPHGPPPFPLLVTCRAAAPTAASALAGHGRSLAETAGADLACNGRSSATTAATDLGRRACQSTMVCSPSLPPLILLQRNKFSSVQLNDHAKQDSS
jgi:hypothetical protein